MGRARYSPEQQAFYARYLRSPEWRARKERRIARAGRRCEFETMRLGAGGFKRVRCERTRYLCAHHNSYANLGAEPDCDLDVYCWFHHYLEHLLWKRCPRCTVPCLEHDEAAEKWFLAVLATLGIDLDAPGPEDWKRLPNKEYFLAMVPSLCPKCLPSFNEES